jgi:hypothetical protein
MAGRSSHPDIQSHEQSFGAGIRWSVHLEWLGKLALWLVFCYTTTGCIVRVYQPLKGLHQPVVVDPQLPNFQDVRLNMRCFPGELLNAQEANMLCQKVGTLFENQGALVLYGDEEEEEDEDEETTEEEGEEAEETPAPPAQTTELTLELRARKLHEANNLLSWALCLASFTVLPGVSESTFAQDVLVRDATGSLLISQSLEGRLVLRFGAGPYLGNKLLDLTVREEEDELTGDAANEDLSEDMYRQMSQLLFNAKIQSQVQEASW